MIPNVQRTDAAVVRGANDTFQTDERKVYLPTFICTTYRNVPAFVLKELYIKLDLLFYQS